MSLSDAQKKILEEIDIWYRAILRKDDALQPYEARLFKAYAEWRHALQAKSPAIPPPPPPPPPRPSRAPTKEIPAAFLGEPPSRRLSKPSSVVDASSGTRRREDYEELDFEEKPTRRTPPELQEILVWKTRIPSPPLPKKRTKAF